MKRMWVAVLGIGLFVCGAGAQDQPALKTQKDKISYAIGLEMGKGVKEQGFDVDPAIVAMGIKDALAGGKAQLTDEDFRKIIGDVQEEMKQKQMQAMEEAATQNKKEGDAFLAENTKKAGVVTLPSGLQYKVITAGQGKNRRKPTRSCATTRARSWMEPSSIVPPRPGSPCPSISKGSSPASRKRCCSCRLVPSGKSSSHPAWPTVSAERET